MLMLYVEYLHTWNVRVVVVEEVVVVVIVVV